MDLTTCIYTHFSKKLNENRHLAPPSACLLKGTLDRVLEFAPELFDGQVVLFYDSPVGETKYRANLEELCRSFSIEFVVRNYSSYRRMVLDAFEDFVKTRYYFSLEHDWWFNQRVPVIKLLKLMDDFHWVHYVKLWTFHDQDRRFKPHSRKILQEFQNDHKATKDLRINDLEVIADTLWSSNPHFGRVSKYKLDWIPEIKNRCICPESNGNAGGIEEVLTMDCMRDFRDLPFGEANAKWGIYNQTSSKPFADHVGV